MTKFLFSGAFVLGALAILWIAKIFLGADTLGLAVTVLIGIVYAIGAWELVMFRRDSNQLNSALNKLSEPIDNLNEWLTNISPNLQTSVRVRIEGGRNALPTPVITPYLVGLLVMLGLLGTFIGMVDTLNGAVLALEGDSELEAIRAGLAAPIEGLGLAFGTSVAGVAGSAMLGLLSTISRKERLQVSQLLDNKIVNELRSFSINHQQQLAFQALQDQAQALPAFVDKLDLLSSKIESMTQDMSNNLLSSQVEFQNTVSESYSQLGDSLTESFNANLVENAELVRTSIEPMSEKVLNQLNETALETQTILSDINKKQLDSLNSTAKSNSDLLREAFDTCLAKQGTSTEAIVSSVNDSLKSVSNDLQTTSQELLNSFAESNTQSLEQQSQQAINLGDTLNKQLEQLRADENQRTNSTIDRLSNLEAMVADHLSQLGKGLEEPMLNLIDSASKTPKAAADVIEKLRGEISKNIERDNELITERTHLMDRLNELSTTVEKNAVNQQNLMTSLVNSSTETLSNVSTQFESHIEKQTTKLSDAAEYFSASSVEIASLGDAFSAAVNLFSESNSALIKNLSDIESALEQSNTRSDEQLSYYVAQAREIIDHNLLSHKEILDSMGQKLQSGVKG